MNAEPDTTEAMPETPAEWAVVSQMGHVQFSGRITEEERFGGKLGRCDVPQRDGTFLTRYFTAASLYSMVPCTEAYARALNAAPVNGITPLALPAAETETCRQCGRGVSELFDGRCSDCDPGD